MRSRAALLLPMILGLIPTLARCRSATQMVVEVSTDLPCDKHGGTSIAVGRVGAVDGRSPAALATTCNNGTVGSLVLVPSDEEDGEVAFQVTTGVGVDPSTCGGVSSKTCIVARRQLRYLPHESLHVRVPMKQVCVGVSCDPASTCFDGRCVSAVLDPAKCADGVCSEEALGGSIGAPTLSELEMAIGEDHACLLRDGQVFCWGDNSAGQLGHGPGPDLSIPQRVTELSDVVGIATGSFTSGAVTKDGRVHLWGQSGAGTIPAPGDSSRPLGVETVNPASALCIATSHACALDSSKTKIECWGTVAGVALTQKVVTVDRTIAAVSCGVDATVVQMTDGTVWTAGAGSALGRGEGAATSEQPIAVPSLTGIVAVASHREAYFALRSDGTGFAWGESRGAEINGQPSGTAIPVALEPRFSGFSRVVVGVHHACGLANGDVRCWGGNEWGQLGRSNKETVVSSEPLAILLPARAVKLWAGGSMTCARLETGHVYCWGANDNGQLGIGTIEADVIEHPRPTQFAIP